MANNRVSKKVSDLYPEFKQEGVPYLVGTGKGGVAVQFAKVTQAGAAPFAVTFAGLGLKDMNDTDYGVFVNGPNGDENGDPSTYATTGFSITGGADTEVLRVMIVGRMKDQAR